MGVRLAVAALSLPVLFCISVGLIVRMALAFVLVIGLVERLVPCSMGFGMSLVTS